MTAAAPLLRASGVGKRFGGVLALSEVSLEVAAGEIVGVIGPNGAGKSTFFNLVGGLHDLSEGEIFFDGEAIGRLPVHERCRRGIARTFQIVRLFRGMSVLENVLVGRHRRFRGGFLTPLARPAAIHADERAAQDRALALLDYFGLLAAKDLPAANLPHGQQRLVEIARALACEPRLLLLDEPAAGLNPNEARALQKWLEEINGRGITIVVVEHNIGFVMSMSDRVAVLDHGRLLTQGLPAEIQRDPRVIEAYLGTRRRA